LRITQIITIVLLVFIPIGAHCQTFEFRHTANTQYRIISVASQDVYYNGILSHRGETLNRIMVQVTDVVNGRGVHNAVFQTSDRMFYSSPYRLGENVSVYNWSREYSSVFERDRFGTLTIAPQYYMPVKRNVPVFPNRNLNAGDRWSVDGYEVHDFSDAFGIAQPYVIPFRANYQYIGERLYREIAYPAITVNYRIEYSPAPVRGAIYPVNIEGEFDQVIYWDRSIGQPRAQDERFRITFVLSNGHQIEFRGTSLSELVESPIMNRDRLVQEITGEIGRLGLGDVNVRAVEEGVSISLENIQFYANSQRMLPGEQEKLDRIAAILNRYRDRDIMVSGHTALAGTEEERMILSQTRARSVADYLITRNVRTAERIVVRGFGAEKPLPDADNNTEEGRRRNRRVEITILEN